MSDPSDAHEVSSADQGGDALPLPETPNGADADAAAGSNTLDPQALSDRPVAERVPTFDRASKNSQESIVSNSTVDKDPDFVKPSSGKLNIAAKLRKKAAQAKDSAVDSKTKEEKHNDDELPPPTSRPTSLGAIKGGQSSRPSIVELNPEILTTPRAVQDADDHHIQSVELAPSPHQRQQEEEKKLSPEDTSSKTGSHHSRSGSMAVPEFTDTDVAQIPFEVGMAELKRLAVVLKCLVERKPKFLAALSETNALEAVKIALQSELAQNDEADRPLTMISDIALQDIALKAKKDAYSHLKESQRKPGLASAAKSFGAFLELLRNAQGNTPNEAGDDKKVVAREPSAESALGQQSESHRSSLNVKSDDPLRRTVTVVANRLLQRPDPFAAAFSQSSRRQRRKSSIEDLSLTELLERPEEEKISSEVQWNFDQLKKRILSDKLAMACTATSCKRYNQLIRFMDHNYHKYQRAWCQLTGKSMESSELEQSEKKKGFGCGGSENTEEDHRDILNLPDTDLYWLIVLQSKYQEIKASMGDPVSFIENGFLSNIDNILCTLLYLSRDFADRIKAEEKAHENKKMKESEELTEREKRCQEYVAKLDHSCPQRVSTRVSLFFILLLGLVMFGFVATTWSWIVSYQNNQLQAADNLLTEYIEDGEMLLGRAARDALKASAEYGGLAASLGALNNTAAGLLAGSVEPLQSLMFSTLLQFAVDGVHLSFADGGFVGAYRVDRSVSVPSSLDIDFPRAQDDSPDIEATTSQVRFVQRYNGPGGEWKQCLVKSRGRRGLCQSWSSTPPPVNQSYWYRLALTHRKAAWSEIYPLVLPLTTDETAPLLPNIAAASVTSEQAGWTLVVPFYDASNALYAVLGIDISSLRLSKMMAEIGQYKNGVTYMTDSKWNVLAASDLSMAIDFAVINYTASAGLTRSGTVSRLSDNVQASAANLKEGGSLSSTVADLPAIFRAKAVVTSENLRSFARKVTLVPTLDLAIVTYIPRSDYLSFTRTGFVGALVCGILAILCTIGIAFTSYSLATLKKEEKKEKAERKLQGQKSSRILDTEADEPARRSRTISDDSAHLLTTRDLLETQVKHRRGEEHIHPYFRKLLQFTRAVLGRYFLYDDVEKERVALLYMMLQTLLCFVLLLLVAVWFDWESNARNERSDITESMSTLSENRVFREVTSLMQTTLEGTNRIGQLSSIGLVRAISASGAVNETIDRYFLSAMEAVQRRAFAVSEIKNSYVPVVYSIFTAFADGNFIGVEVYNRSLANTGASPLVVVAKDQFSGNCYTKYFTKNAPTLPTVAQPSMLSPSQVRDANRELYRSPGCSYIPQNQKYYTKAVAAGGAFVWSDVFTFYQDWDTEQNFPERHITLSKTIFDQSGTTLGVVGVELTLEGMHDFLSLLQFQITQNFVSYIMQRDGLVVAASVVEDRSERGHTYLATRSSNSVIVSSATFLINTLAGGLAGISNTNNSPTRPTRELQAPLTSLWVVNASNLDWIIDVEMPVEGMVQQFDNRLTRARIISIGVITAVIFCLVNGYHSFSTRVLEDHKQIKQRSKLADQLGSSKVSKRALQKWMDVIRWRVLRACTATYLRKNGDAIIHYPVLAEDFKRHHLVTAVEHISDSQLQRNVLTVASLALGGYKEFREKEHRALVEAGVINNSDTDHDEDAPRLTMSWKTEEEKKQLEEATDLRELRAQKLAELEAQDADSSGDDDDELHSSDDELELSAEAKQARLERKADKASRKAKEQKQERKRHRNESRWMSNMLKSTIDPLTVYNFQHSTAWGVWYTLVVVGHIGLFFLEPDTYFDLRRDGQNVTVTTLEAFCLFFECADVAMDLSIKYVWDSEQDSLTRLKTRKLDIAYTVVVFLVAVDWILTASVDFSYEYIFPLRPFILVLNNGSVRNATWNFIVTLFKARHVIFLYLFTVIVGAAMGVILFRRLLSNDGPQSSYANFIRAIVTTFTYVSTGENYTELVYPTIESSVFYIVYWLFFLVVGKFFVLAMVIGLFQQGYGDLRESKLRERKVLHRMGMIAAFILLDLDSSGALSKKEFSDFLKEMQPEMSEDEIADIFDCINKDEQSIERLQRYARRASSAWEEEKLLMSELSPIANHAATEEEEETIDVEEFVRGIEMLSWRRLNRKTMIMDVRKFTNRVRVYIQHMILKTTWFNDLRLLLMLANVFVAAMYGIYDNTSLLDKAMGVFVLVWTLEILLRMFAYTPKQYWFLSTYQHHEDAEYDMFANRFDLVIVGVSFMAWITTIAVAGGIDFDKRDWLRFVMTFPLLRLFSLIRRTRNLVFTLIKLLPEFLSIFILLLLIFFVYGVIGVWLFSEKFREVLDEPRPQASFDSIGPSLLTLFQLLVGEGWHDVMYAAIRATRSFVVAWYFVTFIILVTTLFANVFIGLILDAFQTLVNQEKEEKKNYRELLRDSKAQAQRRKKKKQARERADLQTVREASSESVQSGHVASKVRFQ